MKKAVLLWLLLFIFICGYCSSSWGEWKISIKESAVVNGNRVIFKEIALPTPYCSVNEWSKIKDIKLWKSPKTNRKIVIDQSNLKELLKYYIGDLVDFCILPKQIVIQRGGKIIPKSQLFSMIEKNIREIYYNKEYKIRNLRIPEHLFLKSKEVKILCCIEPKIKPGMNTVIFKIFDVYGKLKRKVAGSFFLDVWDNVICAARPLNRGDIIGPEEITFKRKNLAYLPFKIWNGKGGPWRIKRPIGRGQVIYLKDIEPKPVICRNQKVFLVYEKGFILLKVPAKALEDGTIGELIKVMNLESKKIVIGKVMDKDKVIIP